MAAAAAEGLPPWGAEPRSPGLLQRIYARLRPPRSLKVTPAGRTYLVVTLGVGLGALNTGNNLLYMVLGLLLSLIVVSGVLSERCLRGLEVRRLGTDAAFAQEPFAYRWALRRKRGHAFALEVGEAHRHLEGSGRLAHLPPGEEVVVRADLRAAHRGPHALAAVRVTTRFPFGLFAKTREVAAPGVLLVYPRRLPPARAGQAPDQGEDGALSRVRRGGGAGDVMGLVPLRDGEDARHVHGRRSAALGQWVRLEREREEKRTFHLELRREAPSPALERECEEVAAKARGLLRQGHEVGLALPRVRLRPASGPAQERRILSALAHAGFRAEAPR